MATLLLLLMYFAAAASFRFSPPLSLRRLHRQSSCMQCGAVVAQQPPAAITLLVLPKSESSLDEIVAFVQWWGKSQAQQDPMVVTRNTPKGVRFRLEGVTIPILDVLAEKDDADIKIQVLNNFEERAQLLAVYPQYTTMVESIVEKYVDNLASHFGAQFISEELKEKPRAKQDITAKQKQHQENIEMLKAFAEQHPGDADSVIAKDMGKTPELPDINSMWTEAPLTPEDRELYEKCLAGEILPEPPTEIDIHALAAEAHEAEMAKSMPVGEAERVVEKPKSVEPVPVLPFAEPSPPLSAVPLKTVEETQHPQARSVDATRVVHSWPVANPSVVTSVIRLWAENFTAPGIGMQCAPTATGAVVSFDATDSDRELAVHLSASSGPGGSVHVTSALMVGAPNTEARVAQPSEEWHSSI